MALKAIIHKAKVSFSDLDRNIYADHELTLARHPSETEERMMVRLLAYVLNAPENNDLGALEFGKDMWEPEEPALVQRDLTGALEHEIDLGQPEEKRVVRACGRSRRVTVYTFSNTSSTWWAGVSAKLSKLQNLTVWQMPAAETQTLGTLVDRAMDVQVTIQEGTLFVGVGDKTVEMTPTTLCGGESN